MNYLDILQWLAQNPIKSIVVAFVQFAIIMKIHHSAHNKVLHVLLSLWFIPQDVVVNVVAASIIGLELPEEWLVTTRMKRWKKLDPENRAGKSRIKDWRYYFATQMCKALSRYDMGHC